MNEVKPLPLAPKPSPVRAGCTALSESERTELDDLVTIHGALNVSRACDCSIQSVVKGLAGKPLFESTKRRLRSVLRGNTA